MIDIYNCSNDAQSTSDINEENWQGLAFIYNNIALGSHGSIEQRTGITSSQDFKLSLWYDTCDNEFSGAHIFQS